LLEREGRRDDGEYVLCYLLTLLSEFENQNYGKETTKIIFSKNIQEILMRINQLSNYVATTIVLQRV
jgi:hypothetical protein